MGNKEEIVKQINTFYKIISGEKTVTRDWVKFKELFCENATLCPHKKLDNNKFNSKLYGVEKYIERLKGFLENNDFYEFGVKYEVLIYGNICSVYNEYQAFGDNNKKDFLKEGKNVINLLFDGLEWKIVNMLWEDK